MVTYRDLVNGIRMLGMDGSPAIAHISPSSFEEIHGGVEVLLGGLMSSINGLMMPAFTYQTMITPETGPENNGLVYGSGREQNEMAEFFHPDIPCPPPWGTAAEILRRQPSAKRSGHPILSFTGSGVDAALQAQTILEPFAPIQILAEKQGWVLLVGTSHNQNISLHLAEKIAGRRQFVRWALKLTGACECPNMPGCPDGFEQITPHISGIVQQIFIAGIRLQAIPLPPMLDITIKLLRRDPYALLCQRQNCRLCSTVRSSLGTRLLQMPQ